MHSRALGLPGPGQPPAASRLFRPPSSRRAPRRGHVAVVLFSSCGGEGPLRTATRGPRLCSLAGAGPRRSPASLARTSAVGPPEARGTAEGRARGPPWRPLWARAEEQALEVRGPRLAPWAGQPLCRAFGSPSPSRSVLGMPVPVGPGAQSVRPAAAP